jgi:hypothetical protein
MYVVIVLKLIMSVLFIIVWRRLCGPLYVLLPYSCVPCTHLTDILVS